MMEDDPQDFDETARYWTAVFAQPTNQEARKKFKSQETKLEYLRNFNNWGQLYTEHQLILALSEKNWDVEEATLDDFLDD